MINSLLITRPNHDLTTNYLFYWSSLVIKEATKKNISIFDLSEKKANKKLFFSYLKKNNIPLVFLNGHGAEDKITGFDNKVLIKLGKDEAILKGKVIYARSCKAAKKLGVSCVKKGSMAFIGYRDNFIFAFSPSKITKPLKDDLAKLFLEPSNLVVVALLKGNSPADAYKRSQKAMHKNLQSMLSSEATVKQRDAAAYLWRNIKSQVIIE